MNGREMHQLSETDKKEIKEKIKDILEKKSEISFAFTHGSFVKEGHFRDIDIAIFLDQIPESLIDYELSLETELMSAVGTYQVDVRVLNMAPLSFKYNVIKNGAILLVKDDNKRTDFQEVVLSLYFDFEPYRNNYLRETIGTGV
jgi:predicted nucleotidyltransferase